MGTGRPQQGGPRRRAPSGTGQIGSRSCRPPATPFSLPPPSPLHPPTYIRFWYDSQHDTNVNVT